MADFPRTIRWGFNPEASNIPALQTQRGRDVWGAIRTNHIVDQFFNDNVLRFLEQLEANGVPTATIPLYGLARKCGLGSFGMLNEHQPDLVWWTCMLAVLAGDFRLMHELPIEAPTVKRIKGPTIMLASGKYFDLEDPEGSPICIDDIAHALAHVCRYTGHCRTFYSVAQHSVLVSHQVPAEHALAGLLHDAAEAYIGDVSKPLKILLPEYSRLEARVEAAVFEYFGLPAALPECVKHADRVLLRTEQRDLMGADGHVWTWTEDLQPLPDPIEPLPPAGARELFLQRFHELTERQPA